MAEAHRLSIGDLETRCTALACPAAAVRMGAALDRALRDALPGALAREAEPVLDGLDGVVRIREIALRLDLGDRFEEAGIAAILARRLAAALRSALARGSGDVRIWEDHASYLAGYILLRLGLAPGPDWPFADLAKLGHLPAERAAAELIRARPAILLPLAREGAKLGAPEAAMAGWPEEALAALALALLKPPPGPEERAALLPALRLLAAVLPVPATALESRALAAAILPLALRALAAAPAAPAPRAVVIAAAGFLAALPREGDEAAEARQGRAPAVPEPATPYAHALAEARDLIRRDPARRAALEALVAQQEGKGARARPTAEPRRTRRAGEDRAAAAPGPMRTPFAGLGLLWPSAISTGAAETLGPTMLAQAVWQALAPEDWEAAAEDPALALLFPADPREIDLTRPQPAPAGTRAERLDPAAMVVYAVATEDARWSALLLGDFASRLRGLHGSSHGYLRAQFLRRSGSVEIGKDTLTLRLDPVPLAVVLRMAGLDGPQMRLPQPGARRLVLDLGGAG